MKPEEISTRLENIIENPAEKKAKERAFYARMGGVALAVALAATSPVEAKTKTSEPDKTVSADASGPETEDAAQLPPVAFGSKVLSTPIDPPVAIGSRTLSTPIRVEEKPQSSSSSNKKPTKLSKEPLDSENGHVDGPTGDETYYNLPMGGVIKIMREMGNEDEYWVREDGVKMLGDYVMVAADLNVHPRGSIVETSLGPGIVCDTGDFAKTHHQRLDIATDW